MESVCLSFSSRDEFLKEKYFSVLTKYVPSNLLRVHFLKYKQKWVHVKPYKKAACLISANNNNNT